MSDSWCGRPVLARDEVARSLLWACRGGVPLMFARSVASPKGLRIEGGRVCEPGAAISHALCDRDFVWSRSVAGGDSRRSQYFTEIVTRGKCP